MAHVTKIDRERTLDRILDTDGTRLAMQIAEAQALDTFLSYTPTERARVWRGTTEGERRMLVAAMLIRQYDDWSFESVERYVAHYNERWGTAPTPEDAQPDLSPIQAAHAGALEMLVQQAHAAQRQADTPEDRRFAATELRAATKALHHALAGVRPQLTPQGGYLVASGSRAGVYHLVRSGSCTCEATGTCWHTVFITGYELAFDMADLTDTAPAPEPCPALLGQRLAVARAACAA